MDGVHSSGGSFVLIGLIDEYADELIVDLLNYYQVDLRDVLRADGGLSPRYVMNLIVNLPLASAFVAAKRGGPQFRGWDETRYCLVAIINAVRTANYLFISANSDPKKKRPDLPDPFPTPDDFDQQGNARIRRKGPPARGSFAHVAVGLMQRQKRLREKAEAGD